MSDSTEVRVDAIVGEVNGMGSHNQWDIESLRGAAREFLADLAEEAKQFPDSQSHAQWSLLAADDEPTEDVAFVVLVVARARVALVAGRGAWEPVRDFGENFLPDDAFDAVAEVARLFRTTGALELTRAEFDAWLERA